MTRYFIQKSGNSYYRGRYFVAYADDDRHCPRKLVLPDAEDENGYYLNPQDAIAAMKRYLARIGADGTDTKSGGKRLSFSDLGIREFDMIRMKADGVPMSEISKRYALGETSIYGHLAKAAKKLGFSSGVEVIGAFKEWRRNQEERAANKNALP